jgi:hypothetical protein
MMATRVPFFNGYPSEPLSLDAKTPFLMCNRLTCIVMVHHVVLKLAKAFIPVQSLYRSIAAFSLLL